MVGSLSCFKLFQDLSCFVVKDEKNSCLSIGILNRSLLLIVAKGFLRG